METEENKNEYDFDLTRFSNHRKVIPWMFIIKVILGLCMIGFVYFLIYEMEHRADNSDSSVKEIEIEIEDNQY